MKKKKCLRHFCIIIFQKYLLLLQVFLLFLYACNNSSDSSSFAVAGVPAVTFARIAPRGGAEIHSRKDIIDHLDPQKFIDTVEFMAKFSDQVVNAKVFPVSKVFPKELQEKIDKFKSFSQKPKQEEKKVEEKKTE